MTSPRSEWWRNAVIYQIYPRSFADASGDGYGDLPGVIEKLPYLAALGVDAIWLSPFYLSPMADAGYDVADYETVDPLFGQTADAHRLIAGAHDLGMRVIVDLVPNHTSDEHVWFQHAIAAEPGDPARDMYLIRDGKGQEGELPPNNWRSLFGGPGWSRLRRPDGTPEQWYLHLFDVKQPDLDWGSESVFEAFDGVLRHWLDAGVDGFRVDVAHSLVKADGLPDWEGVDQEMLDPDPGPMWDQEGVHEVYRRWRKILDDYDGDRMMVAEAWLHPRRLTRYLRPDEMHQAFNFDFLMCPWEASAYTKVVRHSLAQNDAVGAPTTWVMSNHDVVRHASRLGLSDTTHKDGIGGRDEQPDNDLGRRRARAATLLMLALPGAAYLYQGEELGLPEHTTLPDEFRQDPVFHKSERGEIGRDGCRIPLPWVADAPGLGFSPSGDVWLPQPDSYRELAADQQVGVEGSTWSMYHDALAMRRELALGDGSVEWVDSPAHVVAFDNGDLRVMTNIDGAAVALPEGWKVVTRSVPFDGPDLPTDTTVWLRRAQ